MPRYFFHLKTADRIIRDPDGTELPNENEARGYACGVARELIANCDIKTSILWRLNVCDDCNESHFEILLASFNPMIAHLHPKMRASVEDVWQKTASLNDTISQIRRTIFQVKGTIARSERAPYLAALDGVRLWPP